MIIVGLTGYARSGKDTVADYLVREHGFTKLSMAKPLKDMLRTLDPYLGTYHDNEDEVCGEPSCCSPLEFTGRKVRLSEILDDWDWDEDDLKSSEYGPEYRRLLQKLGTDCIRAVDENFWVEAMVGVIEQSGSDRIVIPDMRFPNETAIVNNPGQFELRNVSAGSTVLVVSNPFAKRPTDAHSSEQWVGRMGEADVIANDGEDLAGLYRRVETALRVNSVLA